MSVSDPFFQDNPNFQYLIVIELNCVFMTHKRLKGKEHKADLFFQVYNVIGTLKHWQGREEL